MSAAKEKGGTTVAAELQAKHDVLAHRNSELTAENENLTTELEELKNSQEEMRASIKAEILQEQSSIAEIKAQATDIELEVEGETADEMMRFAIQAKGVKNPEAFDGPALKGMFEHVVAQYGSKKADDVYNPETTTEIKAKTKTKWKSGGVK